MAQRFKEFFAKARENAAYWAELATLDFTYRVDERMRELDISRADLAERIGTSPAYITKVLNGTTNFTIKSMATLAHALGQKITIRMEDKDAVDPYISVNTTLDQLGSLSAQGRFIVIGTRNSVEFAAQNDNSFNVPNAA